jgi:hypothetical protein
MNQTVVSRNRLLLVGDNPFHGISHLSQGKAIERGKNLLDPDHASKLVGTALDNGADGFMFSVSDTTLSILRRTSRGRKRNSVRLYAIVPYVFEFVRLAVTEGGIPGLAKKVGREMIFSANLGSIFQGFKGVVMTDPPSLMKAYLLYEESRIRSAAGTSGTLSAIFLHEVLTDMAVGLDMEWVFKTHIGLMKSRGIQPGIHTHNLPMLLSKLRAWGIDSSGLALTTQFNSLGFGMCPSKEACESVLDKIPDSEVIAYGIMASGYLRLPQAVEYVRKLPRLTGVAVGVSKEEQARESFRVMRNELGNRT